jgi:hypothetical protein
MLAEALAHHQAGRLAQAAVLYRRVLESDPANAGALHNLGVIEAGGGNTDAAIALFERAIEAAPDYASAWLNLAIACGVTDKAVDAYRRTIALDPDCYEAHRALGFLWLGRGKRDRAQDHFARTLELRRGDDRSMIAARSLRRTTQAKLLHDAEQFRFLAGSGRAPQPFELRARIYEKIAAELVVSNDAEIVELTAEQLEDLGEDYNTAFHTIAAPERGAGVINSGLDTASITQLWQEDVPGVVWFDDLLTPDALSALRRYLLGSTIWFDFSHIGGFLATYLEDGLACPLILQIADEFRRAFPDLLGDYPLSQAWAFKGLKGDLPIDIHADDAAISLNFWVTPDEANLSPERGGLRVYGTPPPKGWKIADYDADAPLIRDFLAAHEADKVTIPYCGNRAVLFDSRLFHGSDAPNFAPGYANHRINITMLFGGQA